VNFLSKSWCDLAWSPWVTFSPSPTGFRAIPRRSPGVYKVRPSGTAQLAYIGQTGRDLRERLRNLCLNTLKPEMPFNDPHTAAPSLWAWADAEGMSFECSAASIDAPAPKRMALECYLLWQYRLEAGESTLCNHGRFHPRYTKSSDRSKGCRGEQIPDGEPDNPAGGPSCSLLPAERAELTEPLGESWTQPAPLTSRVVSQLPTSPGLYQIQDLDTGEVLYIGETRNLRQRLLEHLRRAWGDPPCFVHSVQVSSVLPHQLKEMENDLIGALYEQSGAAPRFQFGG
jgi:hypothetical protein